jgi:hypothetical protein
MVDEEHNSLLYDVIALRNAHSNYVDTDVENLLAYQLTHRDRHIAWTFAHPTMRGFNIVQNT